MDDALRQIRDNAVLLHGSQMRRSEKEMALPQYEVDRLDRERSQRAMPTTENKILNALERIEAKLDRLLSATFTPD